MLNRLLELLREGGARRIRDLADELNTTPELVQLMLESLTRMGYLKRVGAACSAQCAACPLSGTCVAGGSSHGESNGQGSTVWVLAEKQREQ
jgi:DNA-binding Lrp family transcriptional regulator